MLPSVGRNVLVENRAGSDLHDDEDERVRNAAVITTKESHAEGEFPNVDLLPTECAYWID